MVDKSVGMSVNPYKEALTQEVDGHLHEEPSPEMKKCDLTWSILSTEIDYTTNKDGSPWEVPISLSLVTWTLVVVSFVVALVALRNAV